MIFFLSNNKILILHGMKYFQNSISCARFYSHVIKSKPVNRIKSQRIALWEFDLRFIPQTFFPNKMNGLKQNTILNGFLLILWINSTMIKWDWEIERKKILLMQFFRKFVLLHNLFFCISHDRKIRLFFAHLNISNRRKWCIEGTRSRLQILIFLRCS